MNAPSMILPICDIQNEFSSPWSGSDVVFVVEGRQLHCNKAVLTMVSPVFDAMFKHNFLEEKAPEVPLLEKRYNDIVEFCRCIHPHVNKDVTEENLEVLLSLADEYQCEMLTRKCKSYLTASLEQCRAKTAIKQSQSAILDISGNTVLRWLKLTDQFLQEPELVRGLVEELEVRMQAGKLTQMADYKTLSSEVVHLLFQRYTTKMDQKIRHLEQELSTRDRKIIHLEMAMKSK